MLLLLRIRITAQAVKNHRCLILLQDNQTLPEFVKGWQLWRLEHSVQKDRDNLNRSSEPRRKLFTNYLNISKNRRWQQDSVEVAAILMKMHQPYSIRMDLLTNWWMLSTSPSLSFQQKMHTKGCIHQIWQTTNIATTLRTHLHTSTAFSRVSIVVPYLSGPQL